MCPLLLLAWDGQMHFAFHCRHPAALINELRHRGCCAGGLPNLQQVLGKLTSLQRLELDTVLFGSGE